MAKNSPLISNLRPTPTVAKLQSILPQTRWLWQPWLPIGYLTLLAGTPGVGKSALALRAAASLLTGDVWPDGTAPLGTDLGTVAWVDTEASQALLVERCEQWELPTGKILIPTPDGNPITDMRLDDPICWAALVNVINGDKPRLIVIDSLRGSYRGDENSSDLVELLTKLASLARDKEIAILILHHLRKANSFESLAEVTLDRIRGTSAIPALCRVVWALDTPDTEHTKRVRLSVIKNNLALLPPPVGMEWHENRIRFSDPPMAPQTETQLDRATDILRAFLQGQPRRAVDVFAELNQAGISASTVKRAKKRMGLVVTKDKDGWRWSLPAPEYEEPDSTES